MADVFVRNGKIIVRCATYWIFIIVLIASFIVQYRTEVRHDLDQAEKGILFEETRWGGTKNNLLVKPEPGMESYGTVDGETPEEVMRNMTYRLFRDTSINAYDTYLFGFLPVHKKLDKEERQQVFELFEKITGKTIYEVDEDFFRMDMVKVMETQDLTQSQALQYLRKEYHRELADEFTPNRQVDLLYQYEDFMPLREDLTYGEYKKLIGEVKNIIGRKTAAYEYYAGYGSEPLTYEKALARHDAFIREDKISEPYAVRFSDSLIILSAIMSVLVAMEALRGGMLRRKSDHIKKSSNELSIKQTATLCLTVTAMFMVPVLILALAATVELAVGAGALGFSAGYFAFVKYSLIRILPVVLLPAVLGLIAAALFREIKLLLRKS